MIQTKGLTRRFGPALAVESLDLEVREGELVALLGPNGAGKTTTVRMLSGLIAPTSGEARVGGFRIGPESEKVRRIVGLLTETPGLYEKLSAVANLEFYGKLYDLPPARRKATDAALPRDARPLGPPRREGRRLLARNEAEARGRASPAPRPEGDLPRRADERTRSGIRSNGARVHRRAAPGGTNHPPVHAQPRRGRAPLRPGRHSEGPPDRHRDPGGVAAAAVRLSGQCRVEADEP